MSYYECENTTEGYEVNSCPFCGSAWTELYTNHVECNSCKAQGPELDNWKQALKAWNDMPKLDGIALRRQRSMWASRYLRQLKVRERAEAERLKEERRRNEPARRQLRADRQWAAERAAWLQAPVEPVEVKNDG